MAYVQPQDTKKYEKYISDEPALMKVVCKENDAIAIASDGYGILADATDMTKLAVGFASKEVTAADLAASYTAFTASPPTVSKNTPQYDRGLVTLRQRAVIRPHGGSAGTAQTPGARVYLKASSSAGVTTTLTQPTTNGNAVQELGFVSQDGLGWIARVGEALKYQTAATSVTTF